MVVKKVDAVTEHVAKTIATVSQVTSPPKKLNARDQFVAWISSFIMTIVIFVTSIWSIIAAILDSIADYQIPDRKSTRLNSSHSRASRMPSSA